MAEPSLARAVKAPPIDTALDPIFVDKNFAAVVPVLSTEYPREDNKKKNNIVRILVIL
jgi:hypothetical protein